MALTQSSLAPAQRIAATLVERSHPGRRSAWRACAITLVVVAAALVVPVSTSATIRAKLVRDIAPGKSNSLPAQFNNVGGELFFTANDHSHGWEPWISDGTPSGTHLVKDIAPGGLSSDCYAAFRACTRFLNGVGLGDQIVFTVDDHTLGNEPWVTNGTDAGTSLLADINPSPYYGDLPTGYGGSFPSFLGDAINGEAFFSAKDADPDADNGKFGRELWVTDGTPAGTHLFLDINPGSADSDPGGFSPEVGGGYLFGADDGSDGREPWMTDGTLSDTKLLLDIHPGPDGSDASSFSSELDGSLLFFADDGTHGKELWITDGTPAGTKMVKDINPGPGGSFTNSDPPVSWTTVGNQVFFIADDGTHGAELWVTDGTETGTHLVKDVQPGATSYPFDLTRVGDRLLFYAGTYSTVVRLWASDGTDAGTKPLKALRSDNSLNFTSTRCRGRLFFTQGPSSEFNIPGQLWKTDGTKIGTREVKRVPATPPICVRGTVYFTVRGLLWKSIGSKRSTKMVRRLHSRHGVYPFLPGAAEQTRAIGKIGGDLFFVGNDGSRGAELWRTIHVSPKQR